MSEQQARRVRLALALLWLVPLLWTVNYWVARAAPGVIGPHLLATGRWVLAGTVLVALSGSELWSKRAEVLAAWPQHAVLGALGMLVCGAWV